MARARPMDPEDRRQQLLAAARRVFAARGYYRTGVADIILEAGVARGTFYNYFDSKRAIFDEVLSEMMEEVEGAVQVIDVTQPIGPQVRGNLERIVGVVMAQDVARLLFSEATGIDGEGDEALRHFYRRVVGRIAAALERGQRIGIVREGNVTLTARCLLGVIKEPVVQARLFDEEVEASDVVDELVHVLTTGILTLGPVPGLT